MKFLSYTTLIIICLISMAYFSWSDGHLQVMEKDRKIVLKGQISKALGEYEAHLKGAVEYLFCGPNGKEYESIVVVEATAEDIYKALEKLGVKPGTPPNYDYEKDKSIPPTGTAFLISVEWEQDGKTKKVRGEELIVNVETKEPMSPVAWIYSGSRVVADLDSDDEDAVIPHAFNTNDIVALRRNDGTALFQNPLPESEKENLYKTNTDLLPELGTAVKLTIEENRKMQLYVLISGKVQGVGFRNFTRTNATKLGINGYAKNLKNGKVEVVAEGNKLQLNALVKLLHQGPRVSRVDDVQIEERAFSGEYKDFGVRF